MINVQAFLKELPKTDLHVHVDGSMRMATFLELAAKYKVEIPANTIEGLKEKLFKEKYASLAEFLQGFLYIGKLMQHPSDIERISYELAIDCNEENVKYIEPIIAVHLHSNQNMSEKDVIVAMNKGLAKAKAEINSKIEPGQVPFEYGIVIGTLRFYNEHFSDYYKRIISCFPYYTNKEIYQLSAIEAAKLTIYLKENTDINVSGFEIGGAEDGYPVEWFKETYNLLKKNLISIKAHAGEASGADSIYNAIGECYVERVGHGLYLYEPSKIKSSEIKDKEKYCKKLVDYIGHKRITIEVCLSSNSQSAPEYNNLTNHPLRKMLNDGISVTLATDNRLICRNTIIQEYEKAIKYCGVSLKEISTIAYEGFVKSFYPGTYVHKMEYLEKVQIAIKNTCNKHGIE